MKLVAIKSFTYAGKRVNAGDIFEVKTDRDAKLLVGVKSARYTEGRAEAKISAPDKKLVEQASEKLKPSAPEVKEEIKLPEEIKPEEVKVPEDNKSEDVKSEDEKSEDKPEDNKVEASTNASNKRTYNKRK